MSERRRIIVRLPHLYGVDAWLRLEGGPHAYADGTEDTGSFEVVRETARHVWLAVDLAGLDNLTSDADYYATGVDDPSCRALCRSARTAWKILTAAGGEKKRHWEYSTAHALDAETCRHADLMKEWLNMVRGPRYTESVE
jgi:hypothetical protein